MRPQPAKPPVEERATRAALRILVVDDNRDAAASLAMLLKLTGNETHTAHKVEGDKVYETDAYGRVKQQKFEIKNKDSRSK